MRTALTIAILVALSAATPHFANAKDAVSKRAYGTCLCRFGYGNVCQTSVACDNEGGRCGAPCSTQPNETLTNR